MSPFGIQILYYFHFPFYESHYAIIYVAFKLFRFEPPDLILYKHLTTGIDKFSVNPIKFV